MSNEPKLGQLADAFAQRDAIHIAIAPVIAMEALKPGEPIGLIEPGNDEMVGSVADPIGIVDPYLKKDIEVGDRFYMFLYPQTITSLRHNWSHPAFSDAGGAQKSRLFAAQSEKWLRDFLQHNGPDYDELISAVISGGETYNVSNDTGIRIDGDCITVFGNDAHGEIPDEFWDHMEVVTGKKMKSRPTHFSCSC